MKTIAVTSDWHIDRNRGKYGTHDQMCDVVAAMSKQADVIVHCGDLVNRENPDAARAAARAAARIFREGNIYGKPVYRLNGNHEDGTKNVNEIDRILLREGGMEMLQGVVYELGSGKALTGVTGYGGGFDEMDRYSVADDIRRADEAIAQKEADALDTALSFVGRGKALVALHYAPIASIVNCEDPWWRRRFGSSIFEEVINRHADRVAAVVNGHAHRGMDKGYTKKGVEVYNVAVEVLRKSFPTIAHPDNMFRIIRL